jgi:hypothetical protein
MEKYIHLFSDDMGIGVIVAAKTGVVYANQCNGTSCEIRELEGFFIPLGHPSVTFAAQELLEFFASFNCVPPYNTEHRKSWTPELIEILKAIVAKIPFWKTVRKPEKDELSYLELDVDKIDEVLEAWVPVKTVYGHAVLVFDNCD